MPYAEESYGRRDPTATTLDLLQRASDRKIQQTQEVGAEEAQHERDRWGAAERALKTGQDQYDKSYQRNYQAQRDAQAAGIQQEQQRNASEEHKASMEEMNRRNRMAGAEETYLNTAAADGRPRWIQEREDKLKREMAAADLNAAATRSQIASSGTQTKLMLEQDARAKEQLDIDRASKQYAQALQLPDGPQKLQAIAAADALYPDLSPKAKNDAKALAMQNIKGAEMANNLQFASSSEGAAAAEKINDLDAKVAHAATLSNDLKEYKQAMISSPAEDRAYNTVLAKLDQIKPGTKQQYDNEMRLNLGGSRSQRLAATIASVNAELKSEYARLNGQYQNAPSTQIRGQLQRIGQTIQQLDQEASGLQKNSLQLVGGGNAAFLQGGGQGPQLIPRQSTMPANPQAGALPISFQGQGPQAPRPTMRQNQINRP